MINKTKRLVVSRSVKLPRKTHFWGVSPLPGKHNSTDSVPALTVLRDYLNLGDKEREVTRMINSGAVNVDGKRLKERRHSVGFMDSLSVLPIDKHYRVLYDRKGRLVVQEQTSEKALEKPLKVMNKVSVGNEKFMLVFHDGTNMLTDRKDIATGDVIISGLPKKSITHVLKMQPGNRAFLTGGEHVGTIGTIKSVEVKESSGKNLVHFEEGFSTISDYAFVISSSKYSFDIQGGVGH
ncbi:MAG: 30S ribosomal protein S4e [Candidatus Thermoplasmatota archaeon]|jgi:small subunit ribosomal protein S4e|nr:30S ribosomal protein S4e [Candidatus Thermoplasmatota archaeon]